MQKANFIMLSQGLAEKNSSFRSFFLLFSLHLCLDPSCLVLPLIDKYSCWPFHYWLDGTEKIECTVVQWKQHGQPSVTTASRALLLTTVSTLNSLTPGDLGSVSLQPQFSCPKLFAVREPHVLLAGQRWLPLFCVCTPCTSSKAVTCVHASLGSGSS